MNQISDAIKTGLKERNIRQVEIARMLKVTPVSVHNVITGKRGTPRIRKAIALAIGRTVSEIWPELAQEEDKEIPQPSETTGRS